MKGGRTWHALQSSPSSLLLSRVLTAGLGLVSAPIIARALGPDGRGEVATAVAVFYVAPIVVAFGLPLAVRRLAAVQSADAVIRGARLYTLLTLLPSVFLALLCTHTVLASLEPAAKAAAFIGIATSPLTVSWMADNSVLIVQKKFLGVLILQVISPIIVLLATTILWVTQIAAAETVIGSYVVGTAGTYLAGRLLVRPRGDRAERTPLKLMVVESSRYAGGSLAEAANNRLDQVLALPLLGAYQAGLYAVALTIATLPLATGHAIAGAAFADVARATTEEERHRHEVRAMRSTLVIALTALVFMAGLSPFAVPLLFGESFRDAVLPTVVLSFGGAMSLVLFVASMLLSAGGRGTLMSLTQLVTATAGLVALLLLAPLGALGASIAATSASALGLAVAIGFLRVGRTAFIIRPRDAIRAFSDLVIQRR